jgi:hypothetical protein
MRPNIWGPILVASLLLAGSPAKADRLCLTNEEVFQKFGVGATRINRVKLRASVPTAQKTFTFDTRYRFSSELASGRIMKLEVTDPGGTKGSAHTANSLPLPVGSPQFGTRTHAQVFVELEGSTGVYGLVMLDKPACIESNRAMFETLLRAYENDWPVRLGLLKGTLRDVPVDTDESNAETFFGERDLGGRLITSVLVQREPFSILPPGLQPVIPPPRLP